MQAKHDKSGLSYKSSIESHDQWSMCEIEKITVRDWKITT